MASLGELFIQLGVFADTKELKTFTDKLSKATGIMKKNTKENDLNIQSLKKMGKTIGVVVGSLTAAVYAVNRFANSLVESNQTMLNLTRTSDISLDTFQKWNSIGNMLGVKNAAQQIEGLNERLFELRLTGQGARGFQLAGINPIGQDAEGVLEQIRERIKGLNDTSAAYLLKQMGLDPQMLHILRMSRQEFEALNAEMKKYRLTPEQRRSIQEMNIQLQIAQQKLQYLKDRALLAIMPHFVKFMQIVTKVADKLVKFVKWFRDSETRGAKLTRRVLALVAAFVAWGVATTAMAKAIGFVTQAVGVLKTVLMAIVAHPVIAGITALIGLLMLLVEDFMVYKRGGKSVLGLIQKGLEDLNLKGFIDFPVPEWLKYLIEVIHFYQSGGFRNGITQENLNKNSLNPEDLSALFGTDMQMNLDQQKAKDLIENIQKIKNRPFMSNEDKSAEILRLISPTVQQNTKNTSSNTNNSTQFNQTNYINTTESAHDALHAFTTGLVFINQRLAFGGR